MSSRYHLFHSYVSLPAASEAARWVGRWNELHGELGAQAAAAAADSSRRRLARAAAADDDGAAAAASAQSSSGWRWDAFMYQSLGFYTDDLTRHVARALALEDAETASGSSSASSSRRSLLRTYVNRAADGGPATTMYALVLADPHSGQIFEVGNDVPHHDLSSLNH